MPDPIAGRSLETLVEELATATSGAGGGVAAASATALAAALVELVARASYEGWDEAPATATQAQALRVRALELADAESAAFADALAALRPAPDGPRPELRPALELAANVPLRIAKAAAEVASLAKEAATRGVDDRRADAAAAALLAEGAARAAAHLVEVNLAVQPGDTRSAAARVAARSAGEAAKAASKTR